MSVSRGVIRRRRTICALTVVLVTCSAHAHAQQFYIGGGLGYTFALNGLVGSRNYAVFVGLESRGPLGVRLEGNETTSVLFLTANVTYAFGSRDDPLQPYLVGGVGFALVLFDKEEVTLNAGGGLRLNLTSNLGLFAEARVFRILDSNKSRPTIAPVTVGARVGF